MSAVAGIHVDIYLDEGGPGWVEVTEDVVSGVKAQWGRKGKSPKDRVAPPGTKSFQMDDSDQNSSGLAGLYSIGHANCRAGFKVGAQVRLRLTHPLFGERVKWIGTIKAAPPSANPKAPRTSVSCVDWMEEASRAKPKGLEVMVDTQADAVFEELLSAIDKQPPSVLVTAGSDLYPFALDNIKDESSSLISEFNNLAMSEYGLIYVEAGTLTFEGRSIRASGGSILMSLDEDVITGVGVSHDRDDITNRVQVVVHPRRRDSVTTTVLFKMGSSQRIERGTSIRFSAPYRDPNQEAQRVGGMDMTTPVAGTDYVFNSAEDGSGTVLTSQLTVNVTFGGNSAEVEVTNNGPADGYLPANTFQLRGRGLYDLNPIVADESDATSLTERGQNELKYDMKYQSTPSIASDTAQFLLHLGKDPSTRITSVSYIANWSEEILQQAFDRRISDKVSVTLPRIAIVGKAYYIDGITFDIGLSGLIKVTYDISPVDTTQFWTLEVDGATELDETTVLGYGLFVARWVLDADQLGVDTFLN